MRLLLAMLLLLCSCADSGTRHGEPDAKVGKFGVYWWPTANGTERLYLIETVSEHATLLSTFLAGHTEPIPETEVVFFQARAEVAAARSAAAVASGGTLPNWITSPFLTNGGQSFLDHGRIYIWAGPKLQAETLTHCMAHATLGDQAQHLDPRWPNLITADFNLALQIAHRR